MKIILTFVFLLLSQGVLAQAAPLSIKPSKVVTLKSLAPGDILRVGINLGNPVLVGSVDKSLPQPKGVSIDIANEIGRRTKLAVELISFQSAGQTMEALKAGKLDLIFVAIDPVRGADVLYTPAYIQIEGGYLVRSSSAINNNDAVDAVSNAIVVGKGSAYDLFLTREIKSAAILRSANSQSVVDDFMSGKGNVAAGVKQQLESDAQRYPDVRLLPGRFMVINQAIAIPKARIDSASNAAYLSSIIEELKASGFIAAAMQRHGIAGAKVAD